VSIIVSCVVSQHGLVSVRKQFFMTDKSVFAGKTKYPLMRMIHFSLDAITSFSHLPLQLATTFGFVLASISLIGIIIAAFLRLFVGAIVGQAST